MAYTKCLKQQTNRFYGYFLRSDSASSYLAFLLQWEEFSFVQSTDMMCDIFTGRFSTLAT